MTRSQHTTATVARMRAIPGFADLDAATAMAAAAASTSSRRGPGHQLARAGSLQIHPMLVTSGFVDVVADGQVVATISAGDMLGEAARLDGGRYAASFVARGDVELLVFEDRVAARTLLARRAGTRSTVGTSVPGPATALRTATA